MCSTTQIIKLAFAFGCWAGRIGNISRPIKQADNQAPSSFSKLKIRHLGNLLSNTFGHTHHDASPRRRLCATPTGAAHPTAEICFHETRSSSGVKQTKTLKKKGKSTNSGISM